MIKELLKRILKLKSGIIKSFLTYDSQAPSISEPVASDIDGDGKKEILIANQNGEVICINEDGTQKWKFQASEEIDKIEEMFIDKDLGNSISAPPTVVESEKKEEKKGEKRTEKKETTASKQIIFGTELGYVYSLNQKGKKNWAYKTDGAVRGKIAVFDLDDDKEDEIIFGSMDQNIYVLNKKGKLIKKIATESEIESTPAKFRDLLVIGTSDGQIKAFNNAGDLAWKVKTESKITAEPEIAELVKGKQFLVVGSTDNTLYCIDYSGQIIWTYGTEGSIYSKVIVDDLNNDGLPEIVFGSCDNRLYVVNNQGIKIWSFETDFWIVGSPLLMDIDGDKNKEIVLGSYDTHIYVLAAEGTYNLDYIPGISGIVTQDGNYSEIPTQDPGEVLGKKLWMLKTPGIVVGCCEADNKLVVQTKEGKLVWIKHQEEV